MSVNVVSSVSLNALPQLRKLFALIDRGLKLRLAGLCMLTVVASTLEVLGVTIVFPLFQLMLDRDRLTRQAWFQTWLGGIPIEHLLLGACALILILFSLKSFVTLSMNWLKLRLQALLFQRLSGALFGVYLAQPMSFHLRHRTTELIRNLTSYAGQTSQFGFVGLADLLSDLTICAGIFGVLAFVQPVISLVALVVISMIAAAYVRVGQPYFIKWGRAYNVASAMLTQTSMEALTGIKTVKVAGCEDYFLQEYQCHTADYSNLAARNSFSASIPRQILELVAVFAIVGTIGWAVLADQNLATLISVLALFAAAIYRMMPSVVRIATTLQNFHVAQDAIGVVHSELTKRDAKQDRVRTLENPKGLRQGITLKEVSFRYPGSDRPTLDKITMNIRRGDIVAFVGTSGAGKTTLADVILGLHRIDAGSIAIDGVPYATTEAMPEGVFGYVPQEPFLMDDTVRSNIALGVRDSAIDHERLSAAIKIASLETFVAGLRDGLDTLVGDRGVRISGGQRQRIGIARAIYANRDILVFDEATSAVDMTTEAEISNAINKLRGSKTMIVIAHRLTTVRHCDRIFFMKHGAIVDTGSFDQLMLRNEEFAAMVQLMKSDLLPSASDQAVR